MNIILKEMIIRNFKGIRKYTFTPKETITKVFGKNGACKTTLYDAFSWCLFGKDSNGNQNFGIKPLDTTGETLKQLENEVTAVLLIDGKEFRLTRMQYEKWTTRRGTETKVFDGNVNEFKFNEVPVSKGEFKKRVESEIIAEDVFKLLTDLNSFNDDKKTHWTKRREILFNIAGEVSDAVIEASNEKLKGFVEMLNGTKFDDFKKMIAAKIKKIKTEKKKVPVRLDEIQRATPEAPEFSKEQIEEKLSQLKGVINETDKSIGDISSRNKAAEDTLRKINSLKSDLIKIENEENSKIKQNHRTLEQNLSTVKNNISFEERKIVNFEKEKDIYINKVMDLDKKNAVSREEYYKIKAETFVAPDEASFVCNHCGQHLPTDNIEKTINDLKVKFANDLTSRMNDISVEGKGNLSLIDNYKEEVKLIDLKINECNENIKKLEVEKTNLENLISKPVELITDFSSNVGYQSILGEIAALEAQIKETEDTASLMEYRKTVAADIKDLESILRIYETIASSESRKTVVLDEEKVLTDELVKLEKQEFMCEEYVRTKVELSEENINSLFTFCNFKLFETQVNGAVAETCEAMVNTNGCLVPYSDANTAGKINAGLDIVNTLSRHYNVTAPIFIDHNESITNVLDSNSQIIGLYVSEKHEFLFVD